MNSIRARVYCLIVFLSQLSLGIAQEGIVPEKKLIRKAEEYFYNEDYKSALPLLRQLYSANPRDPMYNFYLGVSYLKVAPNRADDINKSKAIPHLEYAEENTEFIDASYYLGLAYHLNYRFKKAVSIYKKYILLQESHEPVYLFPLLGQKEIIAFVERKIEMCQNGIKLMQDTAKVEFENLGVKINSSFPDYAPAISADDEVLIFTSRRPPPDGTGKLSDDYLYYEDVYITYKKGGKWTEAIPISENINTKRHDASIGLSADAQTLFVYYKGDIYMSELEGEIWAKPKKLGNNINTSAWETHITMTSAQNSVYFVSDRKGGYGGRDIYKSRLLPTGEWGVAENLGPNINTAYDEEAPFIHPDERHLYFSSTGHNSMGGFDIFYVNLEDGKWSRPVNMGHPINTPDDDIYFTMSSNGKSGYVSAVRDGGIGEKDIYIAKMPDTGEVPLTVIRGLIRGLNAKPLRAKFTVTDSKTNELVGIYKSNSKTGKYLLVFPPGKDYDIVMSAEGYTPHYEKIIVPEQHRFYDLYQEVQLTPAMAINPVTNQDSMVGQKIVIRNAFFDIDSAIAIVDNELTKVEVKELAYSSLLGRIERSDPVQRKLLLAGLDTIEGIAGMIAEYNPSMQIHLVDPSDNENLEMHVMGYDTIYTTSANTIVEFASLETAGITIQPTYYVTQEELDTAKLRPEDYLATTGLKEAVEEVIKEQAAQEKEEIAENTLTDEQQLTSGEIDETTQTKSETVGDNTVTLTTSVSVQGSVTAEVKNEEELVPVKPQKDKAASVVMTKQTGAATEGDVSVSKVAVCLSVSDRRPVNVAESFDSDVKRVYCYTDIGLAAGEESAVHHIWYYKGVEMADVELSVQGPRWRTWSSKNIYNLWIGEWRIDITNSDKKVLESIRFTITKP